MISRRVGQAPVRPWLILVLAAALGATVAVAAGRSDDPSAKVPPPPAPAAQERRTFWVTNTSDSGAGSFTQAILDANAAPNQAAPDVIRFDLRGAGPHLISLVAALPAITDPVEIDATRRPEPASSSESRRNDAVPRVILDGSGLSQPADGLRILAGSSTVRGLRIGGFGGDGIRIEGSGSNTLEGNIIGAGLDEADDSANAGSGIAIVDSSENRIGGSDAAARNVIAGNGGAGVRISGARSIGNSVLGNSIVRNSEDGIDLGADNASPGEGAPVGANASPRSPLLISAWFSAARTGRAAEVVVEGALQGTPASVHRIELFATSPHSGAPGQEGVNRRPAAEGERLLGAMEVTIGEDGQGGFQLHVPTGIHGRDRLTATATDDDGNTSAFSESIDAPTVVTTWNTGTGNWGTAANWSPAQLPVAGDDVVIAANGGNTTFTVTLNVAATMNSLTLGGGSGTQTLAMASPTLTLNAASTVNANGVLTQTGGTVAGTGSLTINGTFNWSGGLMTGAAATTVNGPFNLSGVVAINASRTLNNASTAVWTAATTLGVRTGTGSVINNTGTWDSQTDGVAIVNFYGGASTFNNSGTFKKSAGAGLTTISIPFVNTGTVDVQSGTINLGNGGSNTTALTVSGASATLLFGAGVFDLNAGTAVSGPGTVLLNSTGTLNVNSALAIPASTTFTFMAGTLAGTGGFTTNGTFNWSGGLMTGAGVTTANGPLNLSGLPGINGNRTLNNTSTCNWTPASTLGLWTGTGSVINNTGTWDSQTDNVAIVNNYGGAATFNNSGTFKKSAGVGITTISIPFNNTGTVDVQSGTISLTGGGSNTTALTVSGASATLLFGAGVFNLNAGTAVSGPGTVRLNSTGTLSINSPVSIPASTTFTFLAGTLAGAGAFTTNGTFNWSGGLMTGAAITTVNGPLNLSGLPGINGNRTLNNTSTCNWTPASTLGLWTGTGSVINNTGTWDSQTDNVAIVNQYGGATTFNNSGTFKKSAGVGTTYMDIPFVNTGTVNVQTGTISLRGGGSSTTALNVSGASSTLLFAAGVFNLNAGTTISGPGTVLLNSSGTVNVNSALAFPASTTLTFLAGTLAGTGALTLNGTFNWSGGLMTGAAATTVNGPFNLSGLVGINGNRTLNNTGTANWTAASGLGMWTGTGSVINNTGTWDSQTDTVAIVNNYGGATTFNNSGTFKKSAGTGTTSVSIPFFNTGTVDAQSGTLVMSASNYTQTAGTTRLTGGAFTSTTNINIQGGTLAGSGTVTGPVIVSGTGALAPGLSPGTLSLVGDYTQQGPNGAWNVEIGGLAPGTEFDRVNITGAGSDATLAGVLNVSLVNGYTATPGDSFTIMTHLVRTGSLTLNAPQEPCLDWQVTYGPTSIVLTAVALPAEISGVSFLADGVSLAWDPAPARPGTDYDVLRGNLEQLPVGSGAAETCIAIGISPTSTTDATSPISRRGFWYVVREQVAACGIGSYGQRSNGTERTSALCP